MLKKMLENRLIKDILELSFLSILLYLATSILINDFGLLFIGIVWIGFHSLLFIFIVCFLEIGEDIRKK